MLDADLLAFIRTAIRSIWALELLLLMRQSPEQARSVDDLVLALRATPTLMRGCLAQLESAGLVAVDEHGRWRYAPISPEHEKSAADLEAAYAERPVAVINAIASQPNDRLKNFADAFRITKKDD